MPGSISALMRGRCLAGLPLIAVLIAGGCARPAAVPARSPSVASGVVPLDGQQSRLAEAFLAERDRAHLLVLASPT